MFCFLRQRFCFLLLGTALFVVFGRANSARATCGDYLQHSQGIQQNQLIDVTNPAQNGITQCSGGRCKQLPVDLPVQTSTPRSVDSSSRISASLLREIRALAAAQHGGRWSIPQSATLPEAAILEVFTPPPEQHETL